MITVATIAVPTFAVLLGILFQRQDSRDLRARMDALASQQHSDLTSILRSMTELHERVAKVEARH